MKQNNIFFRYLSPVSAQQKLYVAALVALLSSSAYEAEAQVGEPFIHDPSTIALCDGKSFLAGLLLFCAFSHRFSFVVRPPAFIFFVSMFFSSNSPP